MVRTLRLRMDLLPVQSSFEAKKLCLKYILFYTTAVLLTALLIQAKINGYLLVSVSMYLRSKAMFLTLLCCKLEEAEQPSTVCHQGINRLKGRLITRSVQLNYVRRSIRLESHGTDRQLVWQGTCRIYSWKIKQK